MAETKDANNGFVPVQIALVVIKGSGPVLLFNLLNRRPTNKEKTAHRIILILFLVDLTQNVTSGCWYSAQN